MSSSSFSSSTSLISPFDSSADDDMGSSSFFSDAFPIISWYDDDGEGDEAEQMRRSSSPLSSTVSCLLLPLSDRSLQIGSSKKPRRMIRSKPRHNLMSFEADDQDVDSIAASVTDEDDASSVASSCWGQFLSIEDTVHAKATFQPKTYCETRLRSRRQTRRQSVFAPY